ncbi:MAG: AAA family ATPase, partial [Clostridiales bacterium]|nr:AAA family ATPase [Clostridiales bacterium]MDY6116715.1 AAA family ATPase [Anaerovoracaceae bacterium]
MAVINGTIKKIFYRGRGGFVIGLFSTINGETITIKGVLPAIREGIKCKLDGEIVIDEKYGRQFNVRNLLFDAGDVDEEGLYRMIFVVLTEAARNGNTFLFYEEMLDELRMRYGISKELLDDTISMNDSEKNDIVVDEIQDDVKRFYLSEIYRWEVSACENLKRINQSAENFKDDEVNIDFDKIENRMGISFSDEQKEAVKGAISNGVTVITGGPGTGKTTILRAITMLLREMGYIVALAAPTGRAAKRIKESTGYRGYTIHRLLEASIDEKKDEVVFRRNQDNPIEADAIIIDEASMIDVELMSRLLEACTDSTRLVLVGDVDQLPPVG